MAQRKRWETLAMTALGEPQGSAQGSHEEFITEHYWGYTARRSGLEWGRRRLLLIKEGRFSTAR